MATLAEAVESVRSQAGPPAELILVDDGSHDGGPDWVRDLAAHDPRIVTLATGGRGLVSALNLGVAHARGDYIARMDADDVSLAARFEAQCEALDRDARLGAVGTRVEVYPIEKVGEGMRRYVAWQNEQLTPDEHARAIFIESPLCHPSVMLRRDALRSVGGYVDVPWAEDYDLWLRLHAGGWRLGKIPRVLFKWRHHAGQLTFRDARYAPEQFVAAKASYLAPTLARSTQRLVVWGAGPTGRRIGRALEAHGIRAAGFIDIDPRKVGRIARGVPIEGPTALRPERDLVLVAVGARGARELIRAHLNAHGFAEGAGFVCVA